MTQALDNLRNFADKNQSKPQSSYFYQYGINMDLKRKKSLHKNNDSGFVTKEMKGFNIRWLICAAEKFRFRAEKVQFSAKNFQFRTKKIQLNTKKFQFRAKKIFYLLPKTN